MSTIPTLLPTCQVSAIFPDPIPGILSYGSVNFFSGASGVGKTLIKATWCRAWLDGAPILGIPTNRPTKLYYLAVDRPWRPTYADVFKRVGITAGHELVVQALVDHEDYDPRLLKRRHASAFDFLLDCLQRFQPAIEPGSLIFIDPFAPLFIQGNQNDARDVAISIHWLRKCQQATQSSFVCDANVSKLKQDEDFQRTQDRISGSGAFLAYADTQFNLSQDSAEKDATRTLAWTPRQGPPGQQQYQFDHQKRLFVPIEIGGVTNLSQLPEDKASKVLLAIPDDGIDVGELEEVITTSFPCHRTTFYRYIRTLKHRQQIMQDADGIIRKKATH